MPYEREVYLLIMGALYYSRSLLVAFFGLAKHQIALDDLYLTCSIKSLVITGIALLASLNHSEISVIDRVSLVLFVRIGIVLRFRDM
jgi:hypothetical protein